jgi:hypothetical protein
MPLPVSSATGDTLENHWRFLTMETETYRIRFEGTTPLVLHNNQCVNPLNPLKKKIAAITSKGKRKTDADHLQLYRLEFQAGLYINDRLGPYVPAQNIRATMIQGARKQKDGRQFESGIFIATDAPIEYDGPRTLLELIERGSYDEGGFMWTTVVGNQASSIMRTRPRFDEWAIEFDMVCVKTLVSRDMVANALNAAEVQVGLCDGRSIGMGRFKATILEKASISRYDRSGSALASV